MKTGGEGAKKPKSRKIGLRNFAKSVFAHICVRKPGFHLDFLTFCCSFWFFVPTKNENEQCDAQMEASTKPKRATKAITSNQRHFCLFWFWFLRWN